MSLVILRVTAVLALILLLWNPSSARLLPARDQPIVLLDASLSMTGAPWRAALDSARAFARRRGGAVIWRFGTRVAPFDTARPTAGASHLGPALEAAAGRAGEVVILTDGNVDDVTGIPPDLLHRPRIIVEPRPTFFDAYVASVEGPRHVMRTDTLRLEVSYGTMGKREGGRTGKATLTLSVEGRRLASQSVAIPDSGVLTTEITFPATRVPRPGWSVLDVRIEGVNDREPRDDSREFVVDVSLEPAAVIFASPPDWEARFLARTLSDVARLPARVFVETEAGRWRDGATLAPVAMADLTRAAAGARLVIATGDPQRAREFTADPGARNALLLWRTNGQSGDWYVERPLSSPFTAALAGVLWDSLPPATAVTVARDSNRTATVALTARLARRGSAQPILTLEQRNNRRVATVAAAGLWRWAFRGGASEQAYRSVVAALVDWLLEQGGGTRERAVPEALEVPNGLPLIWRWTSSDSSHAVAITLRSGEMTRTDTLRFDAAGRAQMLVPPGVYRYTLSGGPEQGMVAVETYSDEWLPRAPVLSAQPGEASARVASVGLRDRWWLFVIATLALVTEWALRRRQ